MMVKIVTLFLIAMMVIALFGRFRFPSNLRKTSSLTCSACGRPKIGRSPCPCGHKPR